MSSCAMNMAEPPIATSQVSAAGTTAAVINSTTAAAATHGAADVPPSATSWGKRKRCSSSTEDLVELLPPNHQPTAPKHGRHATASVMQQPSSSSATATSSSASVGGGAAVAAAARSVYITLAAESPHRSDAESEDSVYGSFHAIETDVCRDTSDTDSYSTEEFATLDVLEYEIPSDSSTNEELYSHDSSSGTDDFVVTAAQLARAIFASQQSSTNNNTSDSDVGDLAGGPPPALASEFELFADTEESDAPTDPELGRADYWTCVKCKNRQNNPMYRYCERCYQIRKTHFPPRPKVQKTRSPAASQLARSSGTIASGGYATSDDDDDSDGDDGGGGGGGGGVGGATNRTRRQQRRRQRTQQRQQRRAAAAAGHARRSQTTAPNSAAEESDDGARSTSDLDLFSASQSGGCNTQSTIASRTASGSVDVAAPAPPNHLPLFSCSSGRTHDSGFQSSSTSNADLTPDAAHRLLLEASSQETYCSDVEEETAARAANTIVASAVSGSTSTLSNASTLSSRELLPVTRSASSCSSNAAADETLNATVVERSKSADVGIRRSSSSDDVVGAGAVRCSTSAFSAAAVEADAANGMCMMCLTEPKNGVFVHSRFLHLCCCYRCAVKVWNKQKRCPICNCKVKNVMKLFVH